MPKWLKALTVGYRVLRVMGALGVEIKGVKTKKIADAVETAVKTTKTITEALDDDPDAPATDDTPRR